MGITTRKKLACPKCGGSVFEWTRSGDCTDLVAIYDDHSTETLEEGDMDGETTEIACQDCGHLTNGTPPDLVVA